MAGNNWCKREKENIEKRKSQKYRMVGAGSKIFDHRVSGAIAGSVEISVIFQFFKANSTFHPFVVGKWVPAFAGSKSAMD